MRYTLFMISLFTIFSTIFADNNTVILQIEPKRFTLSQEGLEIIKGAAETAITKSGFILIDPQAQEEALKEQAEQRKKDCYDNECLVDTGKMLAANKIVKLEVSELTSSEKYRFVLFVLDVETGAKIGTNTFVYSGSFDDIEKLDLFIRQNMIKELSPLSGKENLNNSNTNTTNIQDSSSVTVITQNKSSDSEGKYQVELTSTPKGAEIYDDVTGEFWGTTPLKLSMKAGTYKISIDAGEKFKGEKRSFTVEGNSSVNIVLKSRFHAIQITSEPKGAKIYFDSLNNYKGLSPSSELQIEEGTRKIYVVKRGYKTVEKTITVLKPESIHFEMPLDISELTLRSEPLGAQIFINNEAYGITPRKIKLANNETYKIKLVLDGFSPYETSFLLTQDSFQTFNLKKDIFDIKFTTNEEAKILINGELKGKTPYQTKLKSGNYNISFRSNKFPEYTQTFNISRDETFFVELKEKADISINCVENGNTISGTSVYFDDVYKGVTPIRLTDIAFGKHTVECNHSSGDYTKKRESITVSGNKDFQIKMGLTSRGEEKKLGISYDEDDGILYGINIIGVGKQFREDEDNRFIVNFMPMFKFGFFRSWEKKKSWDVVSMHKLYFDFEMVFGYPFMGYSFEMMYSYALKDMGFSIGPKFIHALDYGDVGDYDSELQSLKTVGIALSLFYNGGSDDFAVNFVELFVGSNNTILLTFNLYFMGFDD
ncbi:PEGA domain-containing protein [bacterium]|nr:PEGA domain-containing protein [bacterium]